VPAGQGLQAPVSERVPRQTHLPASIVNLVSHVVQAPVLMLHAEHLGVKELQRTQVLVVALK